MPARTRIHLWPKRGIATSVQAPQNTADSRSKSATLIPAGSQLSAASRSSPPFRRLSKIHRPYSGPLWRGEISTIMCVCCVGRLQDVHPESADIRASEYHSPHRCLPARPPVRLPPPHPLPPSPPKVICSTAAVNGSTATPS